MAAGRAEADFGCLDAKMVVRNIYILFSKRKLPIAGENQEIMDLVEPSTPLPPWFTEEDLLSMDHYTRNLDSILHLPYRSFHEDFNIQNTKIEVPAMLIMGERDYEISRSQGLH